jgi:inner membrane transporter RhtA
MLGSGLSSQVGAAVGSFAFPVLGPAGVVAVRQFVAAVVLLSVGRPRLRSFTWRQWQPVLLLALVFAVMNLSLYTAIDRVGLGLAVTLEFLGPLAVALAGSRRRTDLGCAVIAAAGVLVLMRPEPTTDYRRVQRPRPESPPRSTSRSASPSSCVTRRPQQLSVAR